MANSIEFTTLRSEEFVPKTSRYANSAVLYYSDTKFITFETYRKQPIEPSSNDAVAVIPHKFAYRPDLVSQERYGTTDFWWKILEANNIKDIIEFTSGKTIRLPENIF